MERKIPCIKCTLELWEYIKPYFKEWDYIPYFTFSDLTAYPLLVINTMGKLGLYNNINISCANSYNRELITDVEEFLERAAALKGFTYKRKDTMKINGIEIKPGMIITCKNGADYIAFPTKEGIAFASTLVGEWTTAIPEDIIAIRDLTEGRYLTSGKILWKLKEEIVLTMDQIAEKFGYDVKQIKIAK